MWNKLKELITQHRGHTAAAAAVLTFTVILFAPLARGNSFSMVGAHMYAQYPWKATVRDDIEVVGRGFPQTDQAETFYPASVFATNAVRSGQLPMWLPYSFGGIPIMEVGIGTALLYPPKLLMMFFLSPIRQHDFILFTHVLAAGLGMYVLLRCWGANGFGAVFGALVWELGGFNMFWLVFEHVAIAAAWFPLMMLGATLAVRRQSLRWAVATGVAAGMSILDGILHHVYISVVVLVCFYAMLAAFSAGRLFLEGQRRAALVSLSLPMISATVAIALSAASWLSMLDVLSSAHRQPQTLQDQIRGSVSVPELARALIRPESSSGPAGKLPDTAGLAFTGLPAIFLAFVALLRRSMSVLLGASICLFSLGFGLGLPPLVSVLRTVLPYFGAVHPYSGWYLFCFAVAILAALGFTEAHKRLVKAGLRIEVLAALGCLLLGVEAWQLISHARIINPVQPATAEWLFPETPLISTLRRLQGDYHVLPVAFHAPEGQWVPPVLTGKVPSIFDLRSGSGYESLLPLPTGAIWRTVEQGGALAREIPIVYKPYFFHDELPIALLEKISVGLLATPPGTRPRDANGHDAVGDGSLELVYQGSDGWIYRITRARPRAFLVPRVLAAPDAPSSLAMLVDKEFDAANSAIVVGDQTPNLGGLLSADSQSAGFASKVSIISDRVNDVEIEAETPRPAMMVLNDTWDPGWKAYVDGIEQPVLRVNYAFRGVVVPEGQHRVLYKYRPAMLMLGLGISGFSLIVGLALFLAFSVRSFLRSSLRRTHARTSRQIDGP